LIVPLYNNAPKFILQQIDHAIIVIFSTSAANISAHPVFTMVEAGRNAACCL
jgi:hypothetical protein